jgi:hypothetical protein
MHKIILHRNAAKFYRKADDGLKERVAAANSDKAHFNQLIKSEVRMNRMK